MVQVLCIKETPYTCIVSTLIRFLKSEPLLKWFFSQLTIRSINEINELTVHSINSLNPGNDPDSMVAFLPNVRRNTMEKIPGDDPRSKFVRKNTLERIPIKSRFTTIPVETKAGWRTDCFGTLPYRKVFWKLGFWNCINLQPH